MLKIVAIIPARCGSVRFPGKNIHPLLGKPLISHPIEAALGVPEVSRVIVSTDCEEVAEVAKIYGAEIPFLRPPELARARSQVVDSLVHVVEWLADKENYLLDYTVLFQPTTPVISIKHIKSAISMINEESVFLTDSQNKMLKEIVTPNMMTFCILGLITLLSACCGNSSSNNCRLWISFQRNQIYLHRCKSELCG